MQVRAWLVAIAANEARTWLRRGRRAGPTVELDNILDRSGGGDPGDAVALVDLRRALAGLGADDRTLLALRYVSGLDSSEIALHLGCPHRASAAASPGRWNAFGRSWTTADRTTSPFEARLEAAFHAYADAAPVVVEPAAMARAAAASTLRRRRIPHLGTWGRALRPALLLTALLALGRRSWLVVATDGGSSPRSRLRTCRGSRL